MALNDLLSSKDVSTTSLPSWYSTATQNIGTGLSNVAPTNPSSTVLPQTTQAFSPTGQFQLGTNVLNSIGTGAANPWLTTTDASGNTTVSPNVSTPLGGLFQSQKDYLSQILPDVNATASAPAIGSGGFGGKMNIAAVNKARGQAASDLFQKQMTAALQNEQTGVSAGAALGNLGNQLAQSGVNTATYQQNVPYADLLNQSKILSSLPTNKTTVDQKDLSLLGQIGALSSALGGSGPVNNLLTSLGVQGGLGGLADVLKNAGGSSIFNTYQTADQPGDYDTYNPVDNYLSNVDNGSTYWDNPEIDYNALFGTDGNI